MCNKAGHVQSLECVEGCNTKVSFSSTGCRSVGHFIWDKVDVDSLLPCLDCPLKGNVRVVHVKALRMECYL